LDLDHQQEQERPERPLTCEVRASFPGGGHTPLWSDHTGRTSAPEGARGQKLKLVETIQQATTTVPIVVTAMADPVGERLVAGLARLGGNITGVTFLGPELVPKRLELLRDALPTISRVAALWHPGAYGEHTMRNMVKETEVAARTVGVHLRPSRPPRRSALTSRRRCLPAPTR
jgi:hypothetical protein